MTSTVHQSSLLAAMKLLLTPAQEDLVGADMDLTMAASNNLLELAVSLDNKAFVSHHYCQVRRA